MVTAPVARASAASSRRQLESVSRISSWISSGSVFSLRSSGGIKAACSMSAAPAGDRGTGVRCQCISSSHLHLAFLNGIKVLRDVGLRDGNCHNTVPKGHPGIACSGSLPSSPGRTPAHNQKGNAPMLPVALSDLSSRITPVKEIEGVDIHKSHLLCSHSNCSQREQGIRDAESSYFDSPLCFLWRGQGCGTCQLPHTLPCSNFVLLSSLAVCSCTSS